MVVAMHLGKHVDFLVFLVQQVLEFPDFTLQGPYPLLEGLCVAARECATA